MRKPSKYEQYIKRPIETALSLIALIILSPVMLVTAILVRVNLGSPVIYKQKRPGKDEKIFTLYKFRSMTNQRDDAGRALPDSMRLTKFGRLLRSTSLDELPELVNIIKGDMSIVGPRPLAVKYLPYYNDREIQRHAVRPGLTGLAQINGRNSIVWEDRFEFDIQYISKLSFLGDLRIIINPIKVALGRKDVEAQTGANIDFDVYRIKQLSHNHTTKREL